MKRLPVCFTTRETRYRTVNGWTLCIKPGFDKGRNSVVRLLNDFIKRGGN